VPPEEAAYVEPPSQVPHPAHDDRGCADEDQLRQAADIGTVYRGLLFAHADDETSAAFKPLVTIQ